jgi:DNA-3-methyladenine glycosylase II
MDILAASAHISATDPAMAKLIGRVGPISLAEPKGDFESLVDAIVSQQLSIKAAATIHGRLVQLLGRDVRPDVVLATPPEALRQVGLSGQKATYLYALAEAFQTRPEAYLHLSEMDDDSVVSTLTAIKGIGVWTAQMFLMFNLLREDVFPIGDLGVRRAMEHHLFEGVTQTHPVLIERAEIWKPYRSVASLYLWKYVD